MQIFNHASGSANALLIKGRRVLGDEHPAVKAAMAAYKITYDGPDNYGSLPDANWQELKAAIASVA